MTGWLGYLASAAFLAGVAGGVHCAAMCGPIVAACGSTHAGGLQGWRRALAYNSGRIMSYAAAGALAGAFGSTGFALRGGVPAQSVMATLAGATMILLALHLAGWTPVTRVLETAGTAIWRGVRPYSKHFLPADTFCRAFGLGAVWGWLPCGMVYAVLLTAAATAHPGAGAFVMLAFGLGTLPCMLALMLAAGRLRQVMGLKAIRLTVAATVAALGAMGLSFAIHGLH